MSFASVVESSRADAQQPVGTGLSSDWSSNSSFDPSSNPSSNSSSDPSSNSSSNLSSNSSSDTSSDSSSVQPLSASLNTRQRGEVVSRQQEIIGKVGVPPKKNQQGQKRDRNSPIIIGKSVNIGALSWKGADLTVARYIGRVAYGTPTVDIQTSLKERGVDVITLEALETKHTRFASFKLVMKKSQLGIIEKDSFWPDGVIVGRWWSAKSSAALPATATGTGVQQPPIT